MDKSLRKRNDGYPSATKSVAKRDAASTAAGSATPSCVSNAERNTCELPSGSMSALPIALGIIVPIIALVVFFFLHRKYKKRLQAEDKSDAEKYKSMDFGMDLNYSLEDHKRRGRGAGSVQKSGLETRQTKGISMDQGQTLLGLADKHNESLESFAEEDRYKLVKLMDSHSAPRSNSLQAQNRQPNMAKSGPKSRSISKGDYPSTQYDADVHLMTHAQPPAVSLPPRGDSRRYQTEPRSSPPASLAPSVDPETIRFPGSDQLPSQPMPAIIKGTCLSLPPIDAGRDSYFGNSSTQSRQSKNPPHECLVSQLAAQHTTSSASSIGTSSSGSTTIDQSSHSNSLKTVISSVTDEEPRHTSSNLLDMSSDKESTACHPQSNEHSANRNRGITGYGSHLVPPGLKSDDSVVASSQPSRRELDLPTHSNERLVTPHETDSSKMPRHYSLKASVHDYTPDHGLEASRDFQYPRPVDSASAHSSVPPRGKSLGLVMPTLQEDRTRGAMKNASLLAPESAMQPNHRMSVLMRPLPREDPHESSEERANRIRSFYKEYFDKSKPFVSQVPLPSHDAAYHEDYHSEYLSAGTCYDAKQNGFVVATAPFAEPITRRAMTPPPRAPPRIITSGPQMRNRTHGNLPPRGQSSMSNHAYPGPTPSPLRNQSRASSRKPLTPLKTLSSLPTPHVLKDDGAIFNAADFAPPPSFRDLQNGKRPDSPLGSPRPYSPTIRPFVPLNSSFDDLPPMPSPYMLHDSGMSSPLEFAPPSRFRQEDASAAASISSGRSCISPQGSRAVQTGAYRMSRVPKHLLGTKDDIMAGLKPSWDLRGPG